MVRVVNDRVDSDFIIVFLEDSDLSVGFFVSDFHEQLVSVICLGVWVCVLQLSLFYGFYDLLWRDIWILSLQICNCINLEKINGFCPNSFAHLI